MNAEKEEQSENRFKGETFKIQCRTCVGRTFHIVLSSIEIEGGSGYLPDYWVDWHRYYQIIQCEGCKTISFRAEHWNSDSENFEAGDDGKSEELYPPRVEPVAHIGLSIISAVPPKLKQLYNQVVRCLNEHSTILCAIGIRAILEGVCIEKNIQGGLVPAKGDKGCEAKYQTSLEGKIWGLCEKGLVTHQMATQLHTHRLIGNDAAHELVEPTIGELKLALDLIAHVLDQIYEIPQKAQALKTTYDQRREK